jgi:hypothetical protein
VEFCDGIVYATLDLCLDILILILVVIVSVLDTLQYDLVEPVIMTRNSRRLNMRWWRHESASGDTPSSSRHAGRSICAMEDAGSKDEGGAGG